MKHFTHIITGKSEVERIVLLEHVGSVEGTRRLRHSLERSKKLGAVLKMMIVGNPQTFTAVEEIKRIKALSQISEEGAQRLSSYVGNICDVTRFIQDVERIQSEPYSSENPAHEAKLEELWNLATDSRPREGGRISPEWNRIGFQGKNPASDFRGGGVHALNQLLYFCSTRPGAVHKQLEDLGNAEKWHPWACTGINITSYVTSMLKDRLFDIQLYGLDRETQLQRLNEIYSDVFESFHGDWIKSNPKTVMDFPPVFKKSMEQAHRQYKESTSPI
eukprot:CAMPEP_0184752550 /NCGR_PEP_ID=MMETSP0315-20130426/43638_1 /TAXON_ID=101924 /ORGANISM="Rhodosorus marinus, Strain UTEX LB 2760" /LENGTH=274 /DNA_ID=CAMNT_0027231885 /DNA_START=494 /DNA_END=1318 /DNA_ORIENTATION=-